jgi:hypothetical protein
MQLRLLQQLRVMNPRCRPRFLDLLPKNAIFFPAFRCLAPGGATLEGADVFFFATAFFFLSALVADFFSFDFVLASCFRFCANPEK